MTGRNSSLPSSRSGWPATNNEVVSLPSRGGKLVLGLRKRRNVALAIEPWLYLSPALVLIVTVLLVPLIIGISYSLRKFSAFHSEFVGLAQYRAMMSDSVLQGALINTLWWTVGSLAFQFFLGLGLALILNRAFYGRKLVQALVFLPWAVPIFLTGLTWSWLFNPLVGPLPHWFHAIGLQAEPVTILASPETAMWGPITANVWFGIPFFAITLLAARKSIPAELYEAAAIDGATAWQQFTKITLPFLAPTIAITVMLRTVWIATFADLIYVMTAGGPAGSTNTIATYIYVSAFKSLDKGYASALAVLLLVLLIGYALIVIQLRRMLLKEV
jgi:multiple sugar transport system permease protein